MHIQKLNRIGLIIFLILFITFTGIFNVCAEDDPVKILKQANEKYEQGYFDQVISILNSTIESKEFSRSKYSQQKEQAFALLARSYIALDYPEKANQIIERLLDENKKYEAATPMDVKFQEQVRKIRAQKYSSEGKSSTKLWILGGTAVGTGIALVTIWLLKPDENEPLPGPPATPD